jgi:RimJ/RimL family protein N-acetyltransferase
MPDVLPTFRTERLVIRPRTLDDLEACLEMDRDPEITKFISGPWSDPAAHRGFLQGRMRHEYPEGMGYWAVVAPQGFVGWVLLTPLDLHGPEIEIGWRLVRSAWRRGYATEAARPVLDHALNTLRLRQVIADIDPKNVASIAVARKLGFTDAGTTMYAGREVARYVIERAGELD